MKRLIAIGVLLALASPGGAQAPGVQINQGPRGGAPLEITAREGIEWDRAGQRYIARGAARVAQGDRAVAAERLIAFYREGTGNNTAVYRYQAQGGVRVTSATQTVLADQATYDVPGGVLVLSGRNLSITTPNERLTATETFEYYEHARRAVARGDATVISREGRRVRADVLVVYLLAPGEQIPPRANAPAIALPGQTAPGQTARPRAPAAATPTSLPGVPGEQRVRRVEAFDGVVISTQTDVVQGDRAVYDAVAGTAEVFGRVRIMRGQNMLSGERAEVDLNTGVARLLPGAQGEGRPRGLFVPGEGQGLPGVPGAPAAPGAPPRRP